MKDEIIKNINEIIEALECGFDVLIKKNKQGLKFQKLKPKNIIKNDEKNKA